MYCFHVKGMERETGKEVPMWRGHKDCQLPRARCAVATATVVATSRWARTASAETHEASARSAVMLGREEGEASGVKTLTLPCPLGTNDTFGTGELREMRVRYHSITL